VFQYYLTFSVSPLWSVQSNNLRVLGLDRFGIFLGYIWICSDKIGLHRFGICLGYVWICLDMFGYVWLCLKMFGYVWRYLDRFG
jgi:hypothetical protein